MPQRDTMSNALPICRQCENAHTESKCCVVPVAWAPTPRWRCDGARTHFSSWTLHRSRERINGVRAQPIQLKFPSNTRIHISYIGSRHSPCTHTHTSSTHTSAKWSRLRRMLTRVIGFRPNWAWRKPNTHTHAAVLRFFAYINRIL